MRRGPIALDGANMDSAGHASIQPDSTSKSTKHQNIPAPPDPSQYASKEELKQAIAELREVIPREGAIATDQDTLELYGHSENSYHPTAPHSVVVRVSCTEDVVKVVNVARKYRVPIVPYSGATSLEGHFSGVSSAILRYMMCILTRTIN